MRMFLFYLLLMFSSQVAAAQQGFTDHRFGKFLPNDPAFKFDVRESIPRELKRIDIGATFAMRPRSDFQISFKAQGVLYSEDREAAQYSFPFTDPISVAAQEYFRSKREHFTSVSDGERMRYGWKGKGIKVLGVASKYYFDAREWVEWANTYETHTNVKRTMLTYEWKCFALTECL